MINNSHQKKYFFSGVPRRRLLGQEEHVILKPNDYIIAQKVSCCLIIWVQYKNKQSKLSEAIGHFASKNMNPRSCSASYIGFRSLFDECEVLSIKYATNWYYSKKTLKSTANALIEGTNLSPEEVQAFKLAPTLSFISYRPIIFYQCSSVYKSCASEDDALKKAIETDLIEVPYPSSNKICIIM